MKKVLQQPPNERAWHDDSPESFVLEWNVPNYAPLAFHVVVVPMVGRQARVEKLHETEDVVFHEPLPVM
jgi:hypothetical protein